MTGVSGSPPNIIVIMVDDAGYADFGFQGSDDVLTPNLDAFANEGVRFSHAYATVPQCAPSRAAFITGQYAQRFGVETNFGVGHGADQGSPLDGQTTIAESLSDVGYRTALIGKWHIGKNAASHPLEHGFDEFFGFLGGANEYFPSTSGIHPQVLRNRVVANDDRYLTSAFAEESIAFIARNSGQSFFLFVSFNAPHGPMAAPSYLKDLYSYLSDDPQRQLYGAVMTGMDIAVGRILEHLKTTDLDENTLVFFVNDNGGDPRKNSASNEPFRGRKTSLLEGGIRVPFLFRWPAAFDGGQEVNFPVSLLDVAATIQAACASDFQSELDGIDLVPFLDGRVQAAPERKLFWRFRWPPDVDSQQQIAIREDDWKWVKPRFEEPSLYNIVDDPAESINRIEEQQSLSDDLFSSFVEWERNFLVEPLFYRPPFGSPFVPDQSISGITFSDDLLILEVETEKEHLYRVMSSNDLTEWDFTGISFYGDRSRSEIRMDPARVGRFFRLEYRMYNNEMVANPSWVEIRRLY